MNVLGTDVSFYEDDPLTPKHIDFGKMKSAGCRFTIIRAGQNIWPDVDYKKNWDASKLAGLPRGSYWYYDSRSSPQSQADLWKQVVGNDTGELPLFADFEESYKGAYAGAKNFMAFLEAVKILFPEKEIMIYTGFYYWLENVPAKMHDYFSQYELWIANYGVTSPSVPLPWTRWTFWQYSETGSGEIYGTEGGVDLNYFNGDEETFNRRFNLTPSDPPTEEKPMSIHFGTTRVTLNVRPGPSQNPVLFQLKPGDRVEASEIKDGWWKLSKVTRGSNILVLPAQDCFAYQGENNGYIRLDKIEDTPPVVVPSEYPDYIFLQLSDGNGGLLAGKFYDVRE